MNRRDFLSYLGIGSAAVLVDPASLIAAPSVDVSPEYPRLHFTGLKASASSPLLAGQFLWAVDWVGKDGEVGLTHWFCSVTVDPYNAGGKLTREFVRSRIQNGTLSVATMMDGIVADAHRGVVQTGRYHKVPNPDFSPELPETSPYDDEYEVWNPRTVNGGPVLKEIKSMKFRPFDEAAGNAWDFERETEKACAAWKVA